VAKNADALSVDKRRQMYRVIFVAMGAVRRFWVLILGRQCDGETPKWWRAD